MKAGAGLIGLAALMAMASEGLPKRIAPEEFVISAWGWTPGDAERMAEIYECGFNVAGFVRPEHLDLAEEAGLKAIVSAPGLRVRGDLLDLPKPAVEQRIAGLLENSRNHPAAFAYYLRDEPHATEISRLADWVAELRRQAPGARPYINLFPTYLPPEVFEEWGMDYEAYLETYLSEIQPPFLSYDHYAMMQDGTIREGYFQNLEMIRSAALRHEIPFWNTVLSNAHFGFAEPSPATLRFQAYSSLAYGARGISWFTYFMSHKGNYRLAPIDHFGNRTPTWDMLRHVNLQLHALAPTYVQLKSVEVFHHPEVPSRCRGIESSAFIRKIDGGQLVVGEFEGPAGEPFVLIVNTSLHESVRYDIEFREPGSIMMVNSYSGGRHPWGAEDAWLAPGQGMLLWLQRSGRDPGM